MSALRRFYLDTHEFEVHMEVIMNAVVEKKSVDFAAKLARLQADHEKAKKLLDQAIENRKKELGELAFKAGLAKIKDADLMEAFTKIAKQSHAKENA